MKTIKALLAVGLLGYIKLILGSRAAIYAAWGLLTQRDKAVWSLRLVESGSTTGANKQDPDAVTVIQLAEIRVFLENLESHSKGLNCFKWADIVLGLLKHEYRHMKQAQYLCCIDEKLCLNVFGEWESKYEYGSSPIEKDAIDYATDPDYDLSVEVAMEEYVNVWEDKYND